MTAVILASVTSVLVVLLGLPRRPRVRRELAAHTVGSTRFGRPARRSPFRARFASVVPTRRRRVEPEPAAVAAWCDDLARRVRGGTTLRGTLLATVPADEATRSATAPLRLAIERGRSTKDALRMATRETGTSLAFVLRVLASAATHGGPAALAVDGAGAALRQRCADREEREVHAAQARLSAHVLTALPGAFLLLLLVADPDVRSVVGSGVGATCVLTGSALNAAGWVWMRRVVRPRW